MTTGIETKIFRALTDRLDDYADATTIAIARTGLNYNPTSGTEFLRVTHLPAATRGVGLAHTGKNEFRGLFQIDVFWPEGKGIVAAKEEAAALMTYFVRGTSMTHESVTVKVLRPPYELPAMQEAGWIIVPVTIPYLAFVANPPVITAVDDLLMESGDALLLETGDNILLEAA